MEQETLTSQEIEGKLKKLGTAIKTAQRCEDGAEGNCGNVSCQGLRDRTEERRAKGNEV